MKLSITKGAKLLGLNLVANSDFKGIGRIRTGLKLVNAFEKGIPRQGESFNPDELDKKVDVELDLDMAREVKELIENHPGLKGANAKWILELFDAIEAEMKRV